MMLGALLLPACEQAVPEEEGDTPAADFTYSVNTATLEVTFTSTSKDVDRYRWMFGDAERTISTEAAPTFTYDAPGSYEVSLTVYKGNRSGEITKTVAVAKDPVAGFTYTAEGTTGKVTFTNTSTDASSYAWDFGDGTGTSTEENPVYTYAESGKYTVTLTAFNGDLKDETSNVIEVTVISPEAGFTYEFDQATGTVTFTNTSKDATEYTWDFGVDYLQDSNEENPVVTYQEPGDYTVTLTAGTGAISDEIQQTVTLTAPEGKTFVNIIPDGKPDDWADIPAIEGDWGTALPCDGLSWGTVITGVKTILTDKNLYVLLSGNVSLGNCQASSFIDLDNNMETYQNTGIEWVPDNTMGADVRIVDGGFWPWAGNGFAWVGDPTFPGAADGEKDGVFYKEYKFPVAEMIEYLNGKGFAIEAGQTMKVVTVVKNLGDPDWGPRGGDSNPLKPVTAENRYIEWK